MFPPIAMSRAIDSAWFTLTLVLSAAFTTNSSETSRLCRGGRGLWRSAADFAQRNNITAMKNKEFAMKDSKLYPALSNINHKEVETTNKVTLWYPFFHSNMSANRLLFSVATDQIPDSTAVVTSISSRVSPLFRPRLLPRHCLNSLQQKKDLPIQEEMANKLQVQGDESVLLRITHSNMKTLSADVRFSLQMTVEAVKEKLWSKCGTSVDSMSLELYDDTGAKVADLADNMRPFGFYSPQEGFRLHVIDLDPSSVTSGGWLDDTSLVEKYTISDEAYNKREGTFRKFKEKMGIQHSKDQIPDNYMEDLCANIKVGDRCQVEPGEKRGVVKFVGRGETLLPGFWVGIHYDEPLGKHDGMVKGKRYFDCPPLCGGMVRPDKVKVGDYPERDPFEEDEI